MGMSSIDEEEVAVREPMKSSIRRNSAKIGKAVKKKLTINKDLVPLKLAILLFYGGDSLFLPYLTLQMVHIGFDVEEIAIIYAVLPFITFVVPPLAGLLADKFNRYKLFLMGLVTLAASFHTLLLTVDARITPVHNEFTTELSCSPTGTSLQFLGNPNATCISSAEAEEWRASLVPSECEGKTCTYHQAKRMQQCSVSQDDNCTDISLYSRSKFNLKLQLFQEESGNCSAQVVDVVSAGGGSVTTNPSTFVCNCLIQCPMKLQLVNLTNEMSEEMTAQREIDRVKHQQAFWIYFILRIIASSSLAAAFSMLDATAICMVKKHDGDLGKQRLFGVVGQAIFGMVGGLLLDWTVETTGFPDYALLFYVADGLFLVGLIMISRLDVDVERLDADSLTAGLRKLVRLIDVDVFLVMMLLLGTCWGYIESFLFLFLKELNASSILLGTTVFLGSTIGVPFLYISDMVVRKMGAINVIAFSFVLYSIRFFGLSLIWEPWLCMIFEAFEGVAVHIMAVASATYCAGAAPPGLLATLNGAVGSVHYSFGRGVGGFAGGILMSVYGSRATFQMFGGTALSLGIFYFLIHRFYLAKMEQTRLRRKSEHIAEVIASGGVPEDDEPNEKFIIPNDLLLGRRMSCI